MLRRGKYFRRKDQHTVLWSKKPQRESRGTFCKEFEKKCFFYKDCHSKIYPFKMSHLKQKYVWFNSGTSLIKLLLMYFSTVTIVFIF